MARSGRDRRAGQTIVMLWLGFALPAMGQAFSPDTPHAGHEEAASGRLQAQLEEVRAATRKYRDHRVAVEEGFRLLGQEGALMGEHWFRRDLVQAPLDLTRPSVLQYASLGGRKELVGVAYAVYQGEGQAPPEGFAGDQDVWHVHDLEKIVRAASAERPFLRWLAGRRRGRRASPEGPRGSRLAMVHAWVWKENPRGMFAEEHTQLPYLRAGLPASWASGADSSAAWGAALLEGNTCPTEIRKLHFLARLSGGQKQTLERACREAGREIQVWLASDGSDGQAFNRVAAGAWGEFERIRDRTLTPQQRARVAVRMEHPPGHTGGGH